MSTFLCRCASFIKTADARCLDLIYRSERRWERMHIFSKIYHTLVIERAFELVRFSPTLERLSKLSKGEIREQVNRGEHREVGD